MTTGAARPVASLALTLALALLAVLGGLLTSFEAANADPSCEVPPSGLASALNDAGSGILLTWKVSSCTPDEYALYRRNMDEDGSRMRLFATVDGATVSYTDTSVEAGVTYRYRIRSNDKGPRSASTEFTVPAPKSDADDTETSGETPRHHGGAHSEPTFGTTSATRDMLENSPAETNVGFPVEAIDLDAGDTLTYSLSGTDASSFTVDSSTGQIKTRAGVTYDHEAKSSYSVRVSVRDSKDATGHADTIVDDTIEVTVTVGDVDEPGTLVLSHSVPRVGSVQRARLNEDDAGVSDPTWRWHQSADRQTWSRIQGSDSHHFEPGSSLEGLYLRARARYRDTHGSGKTVEVIATEPVAAAETAPTITVVELITGLSIPWGIAFAPDGTMLFTERLGVLSSRLADGTVQAVTADLKDLFVDAEMGLMGIVVDPEFASNRRFYTCQSYRLDPPPLNPRHIEMRVVAWTINASYTEATRVSDPLVEGIPFGNRNTGCRLRFGPDGHLWVTTGDAGGETNAQDLTSLAGKVLRVDASTGAAAPGNPFAPSLVYSYGHRNPQGLALRPGTRQMWSVEHGPSQDDEINLVVSGANYGWQAAPNTYDEGVMTDLKQFPDAMEARWSSGADTIATSGGIFLEGDDWGIWEGRLAVASLKNKSLRLFEFDAGGVLLSEHVVGELKNAYGRLRTPMVGPNGALYVSTSAGGGSDKILLVAPSQPPSFSSDSVTLDVQENSAAPTVVGTVTATDPEGKALTYTLSGPDADAFDIPNPSAGQLQARESFDRETKDSYEVVIKATDNYGLSDSVTVTIEVTNVNEAPVVSGNNSPDFPEIEFDVDGASLTTANLTVPGTYTFSDWDGDVTWGLSGADADHFTITEDANGNGVLTFKNPSPTTSLKPADYENPVDGGGPGVRRDNFYNITVTADDGQDAITGVGEYDVTVTVTNVDETPEITGGSDTPSFAEIAWDADMPDREVETFTARDEEGEAITWSHSGPDMIDFTIDSTTGVLSFAIGADAIGPDYEISHDSSPHDNVYTIIVKATDAGPTRKAREYPVNVTVTDVNETPEVTLLRGDSAFPETSYDSDLRPEVATFRARDEEGQDITFTLGEDDGDAFTITKDAFANVAVVTFTDPPDYEMPADDDSGNTYAFTVEAFDGTNTGTWDYTLTVTPVDETPEITTTGPTHATPSFAEIEYDATTADLTVADYDARDEETEAITWSLGGDDAGDFTINPNSGILSFARRPNFEMPVDGSTPPDNMYEIIVKATDASPNQNTREFPVTVTVTNVEEAGTVTITGTPSGGEQLTATLADGDGSVSNLTWQWARGSKATGTFDDITGATSNGYTPVARDVAQYLKVTASYTDALPGRKTASAVTNSVVGANNAEPTFDEGPSATRTVAENSLSGTNAGNAVAATDSNNDTLTYSLSDRNLGSLDAESFQVDSTGQIRTVSGVDYDFEEKDSYLLTLSVHDGKDIASAFDDTIDDTIEVTVRLENVDEPGTVEIRLLTHNSGRLSVARREVMDPDGSVNTNRITWSRGDTASGPFTELVAWRNVAEYLTVVADVGKYIELSIRYRDGEGTGKTVSAVTADQIAATNSDPMFDPDAPTTLSVAENSTAGTSVGAALTASDADNDDLTYSLDGPDGRSFEIDSVGQIKTRSDITYNFESAKNTYNVTVNVRDRKDIASVVDNTIDDAIDVAISLIDDNDAPTITGGAPARSILENSTGVGAYTASDVDAGDTLTWSKESADDGAFFQISSSGELSFISAPDFETKQDAGGDNDYNVTVKVTDAGDLSATLPVTVTVENVDEAPTIDNGPSDGETINKDENTSTTETIATYEASDVDAGTNLRWTLEGDDEGAFTITKNASGHGVLRFRNVPNFESPTDDDEQNDYAVTLKVSDGSFSVTRTLTVNVENVNERPTITGGDMARTILEHTTVVGAYTASDVDAGDTLTWSKESADDGAFFQISSSGELSFISAPDFETKQDAGGDNDYNVTVKVTDAGDLSATLPVTVTVENVDEAPTIDAGSDSFAVDENTETTTIVQTYKASDTDAASNLAWTLGGDDAGDFTITKNTSTGDGELRFRNVPNHEMPADTVPPGQTEGDNVYDITVTVADGSGESATLPVTVTVNDLNEAPVVSGNNSPHFPEIEFDVDGASLTIANLTVPGRYTFSDEDDGDDDVSWGLSGADAEHFTITKNANGNGVLTFKNPSPNTSRKPADFENPVDGVFDNVYRVVIRADDGQNESNSVGTFSVTVTVTPVDETPEITTTGATHATPSFAEIEYDATTADLTVADYDARDEEMQDITWDLSGADAGDFTINRNSGVLSFAQRPNFEIPVDGSTPPDNVYNIIVKATDASPVRTRDFPVTVTVTNVDETPEITNPPSARSYAEIEYDSGSTATDIPIVATFSARDEEMQDITWDLSGDDAGDFTITKDPNTGNGVVTFDIPPNFDEPHDADSRNTYEFTAEAFDGANTSTWDYAVTVTDVNERPEFTGTPETSFTLDEHDANEVYTTPPLGSYAARDEEGGVTWSLTGTDRRDFAIDSDGVVTFAAAPSFETPAHSNNIYRFKVVATDQSGSPRRTAEVDITVTVEDIEEAGTIEVSNLHPVVGDLITFVLTDPDGGIDLSPGGSFSWDIQGRSSGGAWETTPTSTPRSTTGTYRADEDHTGFEIRAVANYSDRRGPLKSAESMKTAAVAADPITNAPPRFRTGGTQRIAEVGAGVDVGERLTASDRENDPLTWGISGGPGAAFFEIDASSGQLRTLQAWDFETTVVTRPFILQVTLRDSRDADGNPDSFDDVTTAIEFEIIDVEELGVVTLSLDEPEVGDTVVATLEDGDGSVSDVSWQWARSEDGLTGWVNISGATSSSYTTLRSDAGSFLRASVRYTDRRGGGKTADAVTADRVFAENEPATFPSSEDGQRAVPENTPARVNIGTPVAALDPEDDSLTYTLRGPDAAAFSVVANSGQLQSSQPLDFETKPSYSFTLEVHDRLDGSGNPSTMVDDSQNVTITIENVEELGTVTLTTDTATIQARVEVTAELSDGDGPSDVTWQWSRSPNGTTNWVNIASNVSTTFTPTLEEDAGNYIRATATYTDGHGPNKTANAVSPRVGDPPPANSPPAFPATEDGQRDVPEDAAAEQGIGEPVVANDVNNDDLTYSLSGTDSALFSIDEDTGQLRLAANAHLDFEEQRSHRVVVSVSDGADRNHDPDTLIDDTINVVITVTDVNEAPVITGETSPSLPENASTPVATFTGADPEGETLAWSVDNSDFWISSRGQLYFSTPPSFESGSTTHSVTVSAADDGGQSATLAVSISVTDMEEEGVVTITPPRGWADVATRFSAELTDDDGGETGIDWRWERSPNGRSGWVDIVGATSSSYTAGADDVGAYLRATAFYEDRRGSNKTAHSAPTGRIDDLRPATNSAPTFGDTGTRSIGQGTAAGRAIGVPMQTTDEDTDDVLTYSLSGVDGDRFDIGRTSGQLRTKAVLDPKMKDIHTVTVSVHDGFDASYSPSEVEDHSTDVIITVTEVSTPVTGGGGGGGGGGASGPSPSVVDFEWTVKHDLAALHESNRMPTGLWGRDGTLWVAQNGDGANDGVYAYDLETGERAEEREFELDESNRAPRGIWSEGETAWVSDSGRERVFAYSLATGDRLEEREIALAERNSDARGIWSDGETLWVLDGGKDSLFAYDLPSGDFLGEYELASTNRDPRGIWSDGVALWVSDHGAKKLLAYRLPDAPDGPTAEDADPVPLERVDDEDFTELSGASNNSPRGMWSDGAVMYVADASDGKVYTYNMPDAIDARLATLTLNGVDIGEFSSDRTEYEGVPGEGVTQTTIEATTVQRRTSIAINPPDADGDAANGYQVTLDGVEEITVTVTSADGSRTKVYRVRLEAATEEIALSPAWTLVQWGGSEGADIAAALEEGGLTERVIVIYGWDEVEERWRPYFPGLQDVPGLSTLSSLRQGGRYWVAVTEPVIWTVTAP